MLNFPCNALYVVYVISTQLCVFGDVDHCWFNSMCKHLSHAIVNQALIDLTAVKFSLTSLESSSLG